MDFRCYIAMTAAEYYNTEVLPEYTAWMACHFSCYGTGLSNIPQELPTGAMVIINDKLPPSGHEPGHITDQLLKLKETVDFAYILLDFQRKDCDASAKIAKHISQAMDCPVGVSELYAECCSGPVFVNMPATHQALNDVLAPWTDREIWLEAATDSETAIIRSNSCHITANPPSEDMASGIVCEELRCQYKAEAFEDHIRLTLSRDIHQLELLMADAHKAGIKTAIGLYQQLGNDFMRK